jgi:hypothetical protein
MADWFQQDWNGFPARIRPMDAVRIGSIVLWTGAGYEIYFDQWREEVVGKKVALAPPSSAADAAPEIPEMSGFDLPATPANLESGTSEVRSD